MSEKRNDGGPAFPFNVTSIDNTYSGMTLRDYFAAKAMQAHIESWIKEGLNPDAAKVAKSCYEQADAMLTERSKSGEGV